jgi:hypothetical protein
MSKWKRMNKAASKHKRSRWRALRELASTPSYSVREADGVCNVVLGEQSVATFATNAEAWAWIDRQTVGQRYAVTEPLKTDNRDVGRDRARWSSVSRNKKKTAYVMQRREQAKAALDEATKAFEQRQSVLIRKG